MKFGMNDTRARGYKVAEWILNICINYMLIRSVFQILQTSFRLFQF